MPVRMIGAGMALLLIAAAPMTVAKRIPGADGGWDYATVDAASNRLFVSRSDGVMTVDLGTGKVTPQLVPGGKVHASFVIPGTSIGVSTNGVSNSVKLFDAASGKVTAEIKVGAKPDAAVHDPASGNVWVMNAADGTISIVDPVAAKVIGSVEVGGDLEFAVLDGKGHLFVNIEDKAETVMIDMAKRTVVRRTPLPGCDAPTGLAYTGRGVLIAACANGVAKTVDAATGKLLADIAIGPKPDAVINDSARHRAYIPSGGDGTLTEIDTTPNVPVKIGSVRTQAGARTGAVDPATGTVYLPAARYETAPSGKPKAVPGSFEILVLPR